VNKEESTQSRYLIELSQNHMNTTFILTVSVGEEEVPIAEDVLEKALVLVAELEEKLSEFREKSDLSKLQQASVCEEVVICDETIELLEECARLSEWSKGSFNPSFRSGQVKPFREQFSWDSKRKVVWKHFSDAKLSFGAIGKGYALDQIRTRLVEAGFKNFRLNAGGSSLIFSGSENWGVPWKMGFGWKKQNGKTAGLVYQVDTDFVCMGVSGEMEQGRHIYNGKSLTRLEDSPCVSVLVTSSTAARADAFSTAIFVCPELLEKYVDGAWAIVDNEDTLYRNSVFKKFFQDLTEDGQNDS
jgi:thiamine biosynthesis lipoprotein